MLQLHQQRLLFLESEVALPIMAKSSSVALNSLCFIRQDSFLSNMDCGKSAYSFRYPPILFRKKRRMNQCAIVSVYQEDPPISKSKRLPQNIDLPTILPKRKKKPFPIPLKEMRKIGKAEKLLAQKGIPKPIEPPKNGLLVPSLVPVAHEVLNSWKILIKGVSQLMQVIPVYACRECSSIHIAEFGHEIKDCLGSTSSSRQSLHSWVKASVDDLLIPIESYHMYDPFGKRIKHETRFKYDRIPAVMELCIQAGVDLSEYPSCRRTEPVKLIGKKVVNRRESPEEPPKQRQLENSFFLMEFDPCEVSDVSIPLDLNVPRVAQETMDAHEIVKRGVTKLMRKYSVKACGYCSEVHVGPWGHSAKLCGEHKHQWRDGKHGWQDATVDEVFPPNYVWHCEDPKGLPLSNMLKRFYGKAPAVVELCMQGGAEIPGSYKPMMRLDIIVPQSSEASMIA